MLFACLCAADRTGTRVFAFILLNHRRHHPHTDKHLRSGVGHHYVVDGNSDLSVVEKIGAGIDRSLRISEKLRALDNSLLRLPVRGIFRAGAGSLGGIGVSAAVPRVFVFIIVNMIGMLGKIK